MDETGCPRQLELCEVNRQQVTVTFDGEQIVSDAGLLPIRQLDQQLGILAEAARRLPDPRSQLFVTHSAERIIIQQVDQILAGDPDGNDAQLLRDDHDDGQWRRSRWWRRHQGLRQATGRNIPQILQL